MNVQIGGRGVEVRREVIREDLRERRKCSEGKEGGGGVRRRGRGIKGGREMGYALALYGCHCCLNHILKRHYNF